jgi:hypothetical protein
MKKMRAKEKRKNQVIIRSSFLSVVFREFYYFRGDWEAKRAKIDIRRVDGKVRKAKDREYIYSHEVLHPGAQFPFLLQEETER